MSPVGVRIDRADNGGMPLYRGAYHVCVQVCIPWSKAVLPGC